MTAWGPFTRRHGPTGVPADHFPRTTRHVAVDHRGRITALVADGAADTAGASNLTGAELLAAFHVERIGDDACPVFADDHWGATGGSVTDKSWDGSASRFTDDQYKMATAACDPGAGGSGEDDPTVKQACFLPHHEPDGTINSNGVHAAAQRFSSLKGHDAGAMKRAAGHLRSHYSKDLDEDAPDSIAAAVDAVEALCDRRIAGEIDEPTFTAAVVRVDEVLTQHLAAHGSASVTHSHDHSAYGSQGSDSTHGHEHTHKGDASHDHHLSSTAAHSGKLAVRSIGEDGSVVLLNGKELAADRLAALGLEPIVTEDPTEGRHKVRFADHDVWLPGVTVDGNRLLFDDAAIVAAAGPDLPQIVTNPGGGWHAYLCVEGVRTDEDPGRELMVGSCQFPDLPVSLRFLVEDEGGHWGAVTCGRIDTMTRVQVEGFNVIYAEGVFGSDEAGQHAQLAVEEQTQRFVSIDARDVDCEIVEVYTEVVTESIVGPVGDEDGCSVETDWWFRYSSLVIGAATIVATPALQQAVICPSDQPLPWSELATDRAPATSIVVTASGAAKLDPPLHPPAEWFASPGFHVGDPRLIRQVGGKYACPFTVTDDGRVFGHAAFWGQRHTAAADVVTPRSKTYAHYLTGEKVLEDGSRVAVGQITMGCGHADTKLDHVAARAHYDGGYGAVQMADVCAGEDDFGIWVAGSLRPLRSADNPDGPTLEQVRQLQALGLSGDWRWIGGSLNMLACLAVPVQGFPIARVPVVASGVPEITEGYGVMAGLVEGEVRSLVAAGRVQRLPVDDRLQLIERRLDVVYAAEVGRQRAAAKARLARALGS